jgi:hypothetical protein
VPTAGLVWDKELYFDGTEIHTNSALMEIAIADFLEEASCFG